MLFSGDLVNAQINPFVTVKGHNFFLAGKPHYYIGANYWYGGFLGIQKDKKRGIERLCTELDFLKDKGVMNLRVLAGREGEGIEIGVEPVSPPLQKSKGVFDKDFLNGLDILLAEMGKRNMKAVIYLSNNWEWSGGFLQYLKWNGLIADSVFRRKMGWDEMRDYVSKFYGCKPCMTDYLKQVEYITGRINHITKMKYTDDPAIMSWELANEPRPMRPSAIENYKNWISSVAAFIKSKDKNHLVTIGTEGYIGTENIDVFETIHAGSHIDYLTIHIWPKNWGWFKGNDIAGGMDSIIGKTMQYISIHKAVAKRLNKPLVVEEFGLPRDAHSFDLDATTSLRDMYYKTIFIEWQKNKHTNDVLAGVNFWAYGGVVKPVKNQVFWKEGDEYIGDPPMEEQGLNAVFNGDKTTWDIITSFKKTRLKK